MFDDYTNYIESFVETDVNEWSFKSNPTYCYILEHVTEVLGILYLLEISNRFSELYNNNKQFLINLCKINDTYGKTIQYDYEGFTECSPTNLRYILHSLLILTYMKECNLNDVDVIEIGGGYGGLCFYIFHISSLFGINIKSYSMLDLKAPMNLQKKYLECLNIDNVNFIDIQNIKGIQTNSFLISNYAFSEISSDFRNSYTTSILNPFTSHGFLVWNWIDVYNFIDGKHITIEREYPLWRKHNKYVRFCPSDTITETL